jgi:hypothetical protein
MYCDPIVTFCKAPADQCDEQAHLFVHKHGAVGMSASLGEGAQTPLKSVENDPKQA